MLVDSELTSFNIISVAGYLVIENPSSKLIADFYFVIIDLLVS